METLDPPRTWQPDAARALAGFRERQKAYRLRRTRWTWAAAAASITGIGLLLLTPEPCSGAGCVKSSVPAPHAAVATVKPVDGPQAAPKLVAAAPAPQAAKPAPKPVRAAEQAPAPVRNYKESGNALAPITAELFTDYQCPHCATVYLQVMPWFIANYVSTGKVKLVHRDFPLPQHQYAKLAARYANAAGTLGYYDIVVNEIFRTQAVWAASGDVGTQVAQVLPPDVMDKVRAMVQDDAHLDDTVADDIAVGRQDLLNQTPTIVVVYKGKRQLLAPIPQPELLKSYFDELLTK